MAAIPPIPTVRWVLFSFRGRLSRHSFILGQVFMLSLFFIVIARLVAVQGDENRMALWGLAFIGLGAVSVFSSFAMTVKRLHDLGFPGALSLILFVPTVNVIMVILLMILPSKPETNAYGPPPFSQTEDPTS